ncbi:MAG: VacB/RNase II family 3'-5' exoribonuclease [Oscillatoriales cyanobacterium SM2_3_0]|nr:VacB/RNase II family 3'-5' exoribonuclease [Oscillatoriales cyanobacterium SM2_3_0]
MEKGTLIEFKLGTECRLAVAERPEGKKHWIVLDAQGKHHTVHPRQITYEVMGGVYLYSDISNFSQKVQSYLDPSSLEVAWEILSETGEAVSPKEMALLLFSGVAPPECYASHVLLSSDKLYFKQRGDLYEPRPTGQVSEIKHQLQVEHQKQQEAQEFWERVHRRLEGESVDWQSSDYPRLESLERFALDGEEAPHISLALDTLAALNRLQTSYNSLQLLIDLGRWGKHENLSLKRSQIPIEFSAQVIEVAHHRLNFQSTNISENRLDLTHLKLYTIDDESTQEIDDGLSLEFLDDNRQRLWIHIADPTHLINPGDQLDLEARRRTTTVYLPTGMIPMFPSDLATGPMSLVQGQVCNALSFAVILEESGAIAEYSIHASKVKPTYRLTYDDVDEMLQLGIQAEPEVENIALWAKRRKQWRDSRGAISIYMPESSVKVDEDEVTITVLDDSPARQLVAEMMILTGEIAAQYGKEHNLALPYRSQPQPDLPPQEELMKLPAGAVRACMMRRYMPRSEVTLTPARHASLALDNYTQVTSPIRRYSDLLTHFQIKAHLRGEALPFSPEQMQEIVMCLGTTLKEAAKVERETNRYWSLEYLRRQGDHVWQAMFLRWWREESSLGLILLEDLALELQMRFHRSIQPGDRFQVKVAHVDPHQDVIQLQEVLEVNSDLKL